MASKVSFYHKYTDVGSDLTIKILTPYEELTTYELPESCSSCPVGYSCSGNCGRNTPWTSEDYVKRPSTCKLKRLNVLKEISNTVGKDIEFISSNDRAIMYKGSIDRINKMNWSKLTEEEFNAICDLVKLAKMSV